MSLSSGAFGYLDYATCVHKIIACHLPACSRAREPLGGSEKCAHGMKIEDEVARRAAASGVLVVVLAPLPSCGSAGSF